MKHNVPTPQTPYQKLSGSPFKILFLLAILLASSVGSLIAATINVPLDYGTIQAAVNAAAPAGDIIIVAPGTYLENVKITKSLTLISSGGAANTIIQGSAAVAPAILLNGTILLTTGANDVTIGGAGKGFTIIGYDLSDPGNELAAIYFQSVHNNITIRGNDVVAAGEAGILTTWGVAVTNLTIEGNTFSGKTFVGELAGCGDSQFTTNNVPRPLVYIATGSNLLFSNNNITGTAGGPSTGACLTNGRGRAMVSIFGDGPYGGTSNTATICGNTFAGTTYGGGSHLFAAGSGISIKNNVFNKNGLMGAETTHLIIDVDGNGNALNGANPGTMAGVASMNTFMSEGYYVAGFMDPDGFSYIYKNSTQAGANAIVANSGPIANASCATCLGTTTPAIPTTSKTAICDDNNDGTENVKVNQTCATGTTPVWYINGSPASGVGATVNNNGRLNYDQPVGTTTYTYACQSANNCLSAQSEGLAVTVSQLSAPTGVSVTVNGTTVNAEETSVLCDTDTNSPNSLTLAATCSAGTLQWHSKTGAANWTGWAGMPSTQASDGVPVQYQARCRQQPCTAESGIVTITINPKPSVAPTLVTNVSCNGGNNGSISVQASGGTPPYATYTLSSGGSNNTGTFGGLTAGTYTVTVQDANTCTATTSNITIEEPSAVTVTPGQNKSVIFTPTPGSNCTNISAQGNGGTPGTNPDYTYNWTSNNPSEPAFTGQSPLVCPTVTTTYTVTATDANGCTSSSATVTVFVQDVRCGPKNQYVQICYYGVTQCVPEKTAKNYLKLGATLGACGSGGGNNSRIGVEESTPDAPFELSVKGYPNPTQGSLTVEVMSKITGPAQMQVLDLSGRALHQRTEQLLEGRNEVKFDLTAQPSGIYLIRAIDALNRQGVVRVNKQ